MGVQAGSDACHHGSNKGGAALGQKAPRLPRDVYCRIVAELKAKLVPVFYLLVEEPRSFATKTSFGDVDLLATKPQRKLTPSRILTALKAETMAISNTSSALNLRVR